MRTTRRQLKLGERKFKFSFKDVLIPVFVESLWILDEELVNIQILSFILEILLQIDESCIFC